MLFAVEYLFQRDVWTALAKHIFLQFEFAMLDGRDGDAVDIADSAVAQAESREDTQTDVVFLHRGILLTYLGKTVPIDGVERTLYLTPFMRTEINDRIATLIEFFQHSVRSRMKPCRNATTSLA